MYGTTEFGNNMSQLPEWTQNWAGLVGPAAVGLLILVCAMIVQRVVWRLIRKVGGVYHVPHEILVIVRRVASFLIYAGALAFVLERLGVSGEVLWTAFTGFAAVGAVAFFAAWSVLSNIFCSMLIFTTRPFRLMDHVEVLENGEKAGLKGRVLDINLIFTTLDELGPDGLPTGSMLKIPNSLFFQRTIRRWRGHDIPGPWTRPPSESEPT